MNTRKDYIRVIIVDDHTRVRNGIKRLLKSVQDIEIIGEGETGADALSLVKDKKPDIVLLDVELPILRGDVVTRRINQTHPDVKVLALSSYNDRLYIQGMMKNGAAGYITKDEAPAMLVDAIRSVHQEGIAWISPRAKENIPQKLPDENTITKRDLQFLKLVVASKADREISAEMGISEKLVERYYRLLMVKFNVASKRELIESSKLIIPNNGE